MRYLLLIVLLLVACSPTPRTEEPRPATIAPTNTLAPTIEPPTAAPTNTLAPGERPLLVTATAMTPPTAAPTATAMTVNDLPAIELLGGLADSCANAEDYAALMGFPVHYYQLTTANRVHFRLSDGEGTILTEGDTSGENRDGEEGWGFYPLAYEVPANSILTMEIEVYESMEEAATLTSRSSLSFNCTTGEVIQPSFERTGE